MSNGWGHALAAAVGGFAAGTRMANDNEERKEDREYRQERRARQRKQDAKDDALEADLVTAARPVAIDEGSGGMVKPPEMDNRDVGLAENAALTNEGLNPGNYSVKGKAFNDLGAAQAAQAKENSPDAVHQRVAGAYRSAGQHDKAMAMENGGRTAEMQKMQLADARWRRDLGTAMRGGHQGLANLATSSEAGPMQGMKVQAVPSADGKSIVYSAVGEDGKVAPIPGLPQFSNDERGLTQAAYMLDRTIDPQARMQHMDMMDQRDRAQKNADRQHDTQVSQSDRSFALQERSAKRQDDLAATQIATAQLALKEAQNNAKIPAAVKMQVDGWRKEAETISTAIVKAQADGTWDVNNPNSKDLIQRQAVLGAKITKELQPFLKEAGASDPFRLKMTQGRNAGANGGQGGGAGRGLMTGISYKDPVWDKAEANASKTTGVPTEVMRIIRTVGERSNGDQVSPKGAKTVYQFIPTTRDAILKKYGVDAYSEDPEEQAMATAYHLKESYERTGSWDKAMAGFNGGISGEKGTNGTKENRDYSARTSAALASADPMEKLFKKEVEEMNRGTRVELSPNVAEWRKRTDDEKSKEKDRAAKDDERRFNAAQTAYLQSEKLKADKKSRELVASSK